MRFAARCPSPVKATPTRLMPASRRNFLSLRIVFLPDKPGTEIKTPTKTAQFLHFQKTPETRPAAPHCWRALPRGPRGEGCASRSRRSTRSVSGRSRRNPHLCVRSGWNGTGQIEARYLCDLVFLIHVDGCKHEPRRVCAQTFIECRRSSRSRRATAEIRAFCWNGWRSATRSSRSSGEWQNTGLVGTRSLIPLVR